MRRAKVFREPIRRVGPHRSWNWTHKCREYWEPRGYLEISGASYSSQKAAFVAAWWHVKACRGMRQYPETKERT